MANAKILIVDDDQKLRDGFALYLSKSGYDTDTASNLTEAENILINTAYQAVLLDMELPDGNGISFIPKIKELHPGAAIIMITGNADIPSAVEAMKQGANNFLTKPVNLSNLTVYLEKSLEFEKLKKKDAARKRLEGRTEPLFSKGPKVAEVMDLATVAAENDSVVLLQGETGAGKGVMARWIYEHSDRKSGPYVEINCSSLKGELFASELFGHVKGAFTSAVRDREGLVEIADGGTLFLDEIGDMDETIQPQFLKAIEERSFRRVGESRSRTSDFRLICATNKDLTTEVQEGRFRQDLFFRINVFPITLPPLREVPDSIPELTAHFLQAAGYAHGDASSNVMEVLKQYSWPGNIRELKNMIERAMLLSRGKALTPANFPGLSAPMAAPAGSMQDTPAAAAVPDDWNLKDCEKNHIARAIRFFNNDIQKIGTALGLSRSALYRKIDKYGLK